MSINTVTNTLNRPVNNTVHIQNLCHQYGELQTLKNIDLSLAAGQTLALLGHNGAGKSTLIKIMLGLSKPTSGDVQVLGQSVVHGRQSANIGYLPENISFYDNMTGEEVLRFFAKLKGVNPAEVADAIEAFGLGHAKDKAIKGYSKGMKQRLGFAQAILAKPQLLLLDEPTVGLDPQASQFLYSKVNQLTDNGCSVIVCTHELNLVEPHLDVLMMMGQGRCLAFGDIESLIQTENLPVTIRSSAIPSLVEQHPYLATFYQSGMLKCSAVQRSLVVLYLTQECQLFDFTITSPSLTDIYHKKIAAMQTHATEGLSLIEQAKAQVLGA
ncbi:ABC transporter ATP-binding protein [Shewanella maritima]|uniref:ABC transporter ATP-binding protein n=1 Tax=Shewanella maritima TaxID=2520507 RepID=UPI003735B328